MKEKTRNASIFRRIFLIILVVFLSELFLFAISLSIATNKLAKEVTQIRLEDYLRSANLLDNGSSGNLELGDAAGDFIECVIITIDKDTLEYTYTQTDGVKELLTEEEVKQIVNNAYYSAVPHPVLHGMIERNSNKIYYAYALTTISNTIAIGICSDNYLNSSMFDLIVIVVILYTLIFLVAALVTLVWIGLLVKRLNKLSRFVTEMPEEDYKIAYIDEGNDEIYRLSLQIEGMRQRILQDETTKQTMLQNVSHDLKTPIAVIRSYTEAIEDGVEELDATKIILEQCEKLEKKVKNFIQFNRLEYLDCDINEPVKIKDIIEKIVEAHKHITHVEIIMDLDDTIFYGKYENYYTVCENIIENSVRYAKGIIRINLNNGVLTVYNDGKHIDEKFIKEGFKPYEKGSEGKFGLGMSIVCRTLDIFGMKLVVKNEDVGVTFTIKKKQK